MFSRHADCRNIHQNCPLHVDFYIMSQFVLVPHSRGPMLTFHGVWQFEEVLSSQMKSGFLCAGQMSWTTNTGAFYWWRVECAGVATCWDLLLLHKSNTITSCGSMIQHFSEPPECKKNLFQNELLARIIQGNPTLKPCSRKCSIWTPLLPLCEMIHNCCCDVKMALFKNRRCRQNCFAV